MRCWTIQPVEVHELLESSARLTVDWSYVYPDFVDAYRWMATQMEARGIALGGNAPVWAWRVHGTRSRPRPDLRCSGLLHSGTPGVRLELEVPDELALLSRFEAWHSVLNRWHFGDSEAESDAIDARGFSEQEMTSSWTRIFDLEAGDPEWSGDLESREIQACLPYLERDWIRKVDRFIGR